MGNNEQAPSFSSILVLASSSRYRQELLHRLHHPFQVDVPDIDETRYSHELASDYVERMAVEKASKVATRHADALVIGSDQCAEVDGHILGKPGSAQEAQNQLQQLSGQTVRFHTGLCVIATRTQDVLRSVELFEVQFRKLEPVEIARYVQIEQPLDCAGSFKSEGLGISLFASMHGDDPTSLIGLPLIRLREMLAQCGLNIP